MEELVAPSSATVEIVVEVLIQGMQCSNRILRSSCFEAFTALGTVVVPRLQAVLDAGSIKPRYVGLFRMVISAISEGVGQGDVLMKVKLALTDAWMVNNKKLQAPAWQALLLWCGPGYVDDLIQSAIHSIGRPRWCVFWLRAAQECGRQPSTQTWMEMMLALLAVRDGRVRRQAAKLISALSRDGETLPDGVSAAAVAEFRKSLSRAAA